MQSLLRSIRLRRLFFAQAILSVSACMSFSNAQEPGTKTLTSGIELENFDLSVSPDEDFFRFVNGQWLEKTKIPSDQSNYGAFTALDIETKEAIKKLIEEASTQKSPSAIAKQVGDFYRSYTDIAQRNKAGIEPVQGMLSQIKTIGSKEQLIQVAGKLSRRGVASFYGFYIEPDAKRSDQYAIYVNQDGTTLPDRDYYLEDNERFQKTLSAYLKFVETMLTQVGWPNPAEAAGKILELERSFAQSQWTQVELRNPDNTYNKMPATDIASKYASLRWADYATAAGLPSGLDVIVGQPSFMAGASNTITENDLETLKAYLAFQLIDTYAPLLTESIEKLHFDFHETTLSGVTEQEPLWRRGVDACNGLLGMPVGQLYVEKHFSPKSKEKMNTLVKNLLVAFEKRIDQLEWMGNGTKKQAKEKLAQFTPKIGYPDVWKDYSSVKIVPDNIIANMGEILEFEHHYQINKLGKPINRSEWYMPPQTVNAYYNPLMNEIVFPAAILQPPFFNLDADDAVNYGGIGAVIGHEISHGFDDSGRKYDGNGNLRNWWTPSDQEEFEERSTKLVKQYDAYKPFPTDNVNGKFTLGENIGDLGGMSVAYTAYQLALQGKESPVMDGFTGDQRFFIGWAQVWRRKYRDEELKKRLLTDPHSPSQYRCNGIVSNLDPFYTAFSIKPDSKMFIDLKKRVRIW
ncbi:MAG: M13 family metallopeptidase [Planctomycetota bacterium]|nr:M13 family metallopeptidase [Planctomycetota bacterium]